jgi:hypothetical protein
MPDHAAATASRHWFAASARKIRSIERETTLMLALASGKADGLSGCFIQPQDDLDGIVAAAAEVEGRKLYTLQVDRL